eukprot:1034572-Amphidinium_carterae.1
MTFSTFGKFALQCRLYRFASMDLARKAEVAGRSSSREGWSCVLMDGPTSWQEMGYLRRSCSVAHTSSRALWRK